MSPSKILTLNERIKGISNFLFNLSGALAAGTAARVWVLERFDLATFSWAVVAAGLFASAYGILYLLQPDA